jgi:hypothetical protein
MREGNNFLPTTILWMTMGERGKVGQRNLQSEISAHGIYTTEVFMNMHTAFYNGIGSDGCYGMNNRPGEERNRRGR